MFNTRYRLTSYNVGGVEPFKEEDTIDRECPSKLKHNSINNEWPIQSQSIDCKEASIGINCKKASIALC